MSDRLSTLLLRFEPKARLAHAGLLQRSASPSLPENPSNAVDHAGTLILLRRGAVQISLQGKHSPRYQLTQPGLLYLPKPGQTVHLLPMSEAGAQVLAARISWGQPQHNPLLNDLPAAIPLTEAELGMLQPTWQLLWSELLERSCAHRHVLQRLMEVLVIQLLRLWLNQGAQGSQGSAGTRLNASVSAGLSDSRLLRVLDAMHGQPERGWTLEQLATLAGMSRARFAAHFHATVGQAPASYLSSWRIGLAQELLVQDLPVKDVARAVGYASATAFSRVFAQRTGCAPSAWAKLTAKT